MAKKKKENKFKLSKEINIFVLVTKLIIVLALSILMYKLLLNQLFPYQSFFDNKVSLRIPVGWIIDEKYGSVPIGDNINFETIDLRLKNKNGNESIKITSIPGNVSVGYTAEINLNKIIKNEGYMENDIKILSDKPDNEKIVEINGVNKYEKIFFVRRNTGEIYTIRGFLNHKNYSNLLAKIVLGILTNSIILR